jgi:abequosyltransferase
MKKLSICIPTYNRAKYLEELLDSISVQLDKTMRKQIEICISDNASNDDTKSVVRVFEKKSALHVKYHRNGKNVGFDRNYKFVADMADSSYCWVIGSDDTLPEGAIARVLEEVSKGGDIFLFDREEYSLDMKFLKRKYWLRKRESLFFDLHNENDFADYCTLSDSIGAFFSFISSVVFSTKKWHSVKCENNFLDTGYVHVFMLCSFIAKRCIVKYVPESVVNCRLDNDQYLQEKGPGKRFLLDFNAYLGVCDYFWEKDNLRRESFYIAMRREHPVRSIFHKALTVKDKSERSAIAGALKKTLYPRNVRLMFRMISITPLRWYLYLLLRKLKQAGVVK